MIGKAFKSSIQCSFNKSFNFFSNFSTCSNILLVRARHCIDFRVYYYARTILTSGRKWGPYNSKDRKEKRGTVGHDERASCGHDHLSNLRNGTIKKNMNCWRPESVP